MMRTEDYITTVPQFLMQLYGYWNSHPSYPISDWLYQVRQDRTRLGYWQWVALEIEKQDVIHGIDRSIEEFRLEEKRNQEAEESQVSVPPADGGVDGDGAPA